MRYDLIKFIFSSNHLLKIISKFSKTNWGWSICLNLNYLRLLRLLILIKAKLFYELEHSLYYLLRLIIIKPKILLLLLWLKLLIFLIRLRRLIRLIKLIIEILNWIHLNRNFSLIISAIFLLSCYRNFVLSISLASFHNYYNYKYHNTNKYSKIE